MTKSNSGGCDQFETSPDAIEPELRTALCERRQTDRLNTNYSIDDFVLSHLVVSDLTLSLQVISEIIAGD